MKDVFPKDDLELIVEHHNSNSVAKQDEHLIVHFGVLRNIATHRLRGVVIARAAHLVIVLRHFHLYLVELPFVDLVEQHSP